MRNLCVVGSYVSACWAGLATFDYDGKAIAICFAISFACALLALCFKERS